MKRALIVAAVALVAIAGSAEAAKRRPVRRARPAPVAPPPPMYTLHIASHLAEDARVQVDAAPVIIAPGYGITEVKVTAGRHVLRVSSADGVAYQQDLGFDAAQLMAFQGKSYWCVNLLEASVDRYSIEECREEVGDQG